MRREGTYQATIDIFGNGDERFLSLQTNDKSRRRYKSCSDASKVICTYAPCEQCGMSITGIFFKRKSF